jgi:flavin reductase (DIM6/NTAB) family NADH-FMN oxidoreductase RutF
MNPDIVTLFRQLTLGVYVIGVADGSKQDAFTASWVMQASYRPPLLSIAINPEHASYPLLHSGRTFAVSVLAREQMQQARRFGTSSLSQQAAHKMQGVPWRTGRLGAPILAAALGFFDCAVEAETAAGDHRIVLGRVIDGAVLVPGGVPLAYADTHDLDNSAALYPEAFSTEPPA